MVEKIPLEDWIKDFWVEMKEPYISLTELAKAMGKSQKWVSMVLNGYRKPPKYAEQQFKEALSVAREEKKKIKG